MRVSAARAIPTKKKMEFCLEIRRVVDWSLTEYRSGHATAMLADQSGFLLSSGRGRPGSLGARLLLGVEGHGGAIAPPTDYCGTRLKCRISAAIHSPIPSRNAPTTIAIPGVESFGGVLRLACT